MRILFAGTPEIAVPCLNAAAAAHDVCAVLTAPPRPAGRGGRLVESPVAVRAAEMGMTLLQPERLGRTERRAVAPLHAEALVVMAYGRIFGPRFLAVFPRGGVNVHPSLLPRYRGPAPIQAALAAGDRVTGVSIQDVVQEVDAGDILAQASVAVGPDETAPELGARLSRIGAELLLDVLSRMDKGDVEGRPQNPGDVTTCGLVRKSDGLVDWSCAAEALYDRYRAYQPWPGIHTTLAGTRLLLHGCRAVPDPDPRGTPGQVIDIDKRLGLLVQTGSGLLAAALLQLQARKAVDARSFVNGHPEILGAVLGG